MAGLAPAAQMYGVWGPKRAEYLYRDTGSMPLNGINAAAAMIEGGNELDRYETMLTAAQQASMQEQQMKTAGDIEIEYLKNIAGITNAGAGGYIRPRQTQGLDIDANGMMNTSLEVSNIRTSEAAGNMMDTAAQAATTFNQSPSQDYLSGILSGPYAEQGVPLQTFVTPENQVARANADTARMNAQAGQRQAEAAYITATQPLTTVETQRASIPELDKETVETKARGNQPAQTADQSRAAQRLAQNRQSNRLNAIPPGAKPVNPPRVRPDGKIAFISPDGKSVLWVTPEKAAAYNAQQQR